MPNPNNPNQPYLGKTYYSKTAMGRFPFSWGEEALFVYGRYVARSPREEAELDAIIPPKGNNPNIYTMEQLGIEPHPVVPQNFNTELEVASAERALRGMGHSVRVQQEAGTVQTVIPQASDVNQSTIDPVLRQEVMGQAVVTPLGQPSRIIGPGAVKFQQNMAEQLNTERAANTEANNGTTSRLDALRAQAASSLSRS